MDFVTQAPTQQSVPAVPRPDVAAQRRDGTWGHERMQTLGRPLDPGTRAFMEPRFGHDFSRVRVHADASAAEAARAMHARAYTVGQDIVFGTGQYAPSTGKGRELLAHELVHTIQQTSSLGVSTAQLDNQPSSPEEIEAGQVAHSVLRQAAPVPAPIAIRTGPTLMRTWDQPGPQDCTGIAPDVFLTKVVVEQEGSQNVTLHWSDGHLDSGPCSTGKGQCCVDSTTPGGVTCSVARSRQFGSNCTPITQGEPYPITDRYLSYNGWEFWSTFVRSRGIGLHQHHTITGNPISHGCVRLQRETARLIFCGARQNQTVVEVRGFARPDCSDPQLRSQWQEDFASAAANPSDGETPEDQRVIRENRTEARRVLTEAYGRRLSEAEYSSGLGGLQIPRCGSTAPRPTTEEGRLLPGSTTESATPTAANQGLAESSFEHFIPDLMAGLAAASRISRAEQVVRSQGQALWQAATRRSQGGNPDDRPLYFARLNMARAIRQWQPSRFRITPTQQDNLVNILEQTSRGMDTAQFSSSPGSIRILVSGFDPFGSDGIRLGNPSGAVAMALDGQYITSGMVTAEVQSVVFPVRFSDFDAGIVEGFFRPYVTGPNPVTLILMLGMQDGDYEVEEYAARVRTTTAPDNAGLTGGGTSTSGTVVPPGVGAGPEFIRGSLPATTRGGLGRTQPVAGETRVRETPAGQSAPVWQTGGPTSGSTAVEGTAGDYFCNEIFYRTALLGQGTTVRIGFMHVPSLGHRLSLPGAATADVERAGIVTTVRQVLQSALLEYQPGPGDYPERVLPPGRAYA